MPVPSTMMALSDTMVFTPNGRVVSTQAFIIGSGPMATTRSGFSFSQDLLQRRGDEAGLAVGAVVGADDEVVAVLLELVLPEDEVLVPEADDAGGAVPGLLEGAQLRVDRRDAEAAADEDDVADLLDVLRQAERADEVGERVALLVVGHHLAGRLPERLDDHRDGALLAVEVGDGERDALAALVEAEHHEVAGLGRGGDVGGLDLPEEGRVGEGFAADDGVRHRGPIPPWNGVRGRAAWYQPARRPVKGWAAEISREIPDGSGPLCVARRSRGDVEREVVVVVHRARGARVGSAAASRWLALSAGRCRSRA